MKRINGLLIVVSGFSGSGKGTVLGRVFEKCPDLLFAVSATSRGKRADEAEGKNYFFKTREQFENMIANDEFVEYTETYGNYYGTPRTQIDESVTSGKSIILELDVIGSVNIKKMFPFAVTVFLTAPSLSEVKRRLIERGTESEEEVARRVARFKEEIEYLDYYDYVVINDEVERCADEIISIILGAQLKLDRNQKLINKIIEGGSVL